MEVLISMFVLAVGLMGVAALIPAGRARIVEANKLDNAAMVGRAAFRDLQIRGYLKPARWSDNALSGSGSGVFNPANVTAPFTIKDAGGADAASNQVAFAIDPLWRSSVDGQAETNFPVVGGNFPDGTNIPAGMLTQPPLHCIVPFQTSTTNLSAARAAYDSIFRGSFDAITEENSTNRDRPSEPKWFESGGTPVTRSSEGNYSWLATVVSDPTKPAINQEVTVSVAVFFKRVLANDPTTLRPAGSHMTTVSLFPLDPANNAAQRIVRMTSGGEMMIDLMGGLKPIKPGQWLMLAGTRSDSVGNTLRYYRWYRVLSAAPADVSGTVPTQRLTLAGRDWDINAGNTAVWIFDNIVGVYEKTLPLEID